MAEDEDKSWCDSVRFNGGDTYPPGMSYGFLEDYQMPPIGQHQMHPVHPMVQNPPQGASTHVAPEDNFTVLSMGHGSYLRLYHNKDEAAKFNNYELFSAPNPAFQAAPGMPTRPSEVPPQNDSSYSTNMFLNQLVGNWAPNVSGTYTPFGEVVDKAEDAAAGTLPCASQRAPDAVSGPEMVGKPFEINRPAPLTENGQSQLRDAKKPRMVAEVKPMRMTYSDVLSKNVAINTAPSAAATAPTPKTPQSEKKGGEKKSTHGQEGQPKAKKTSTPSTRVESHGPAAQQAASTKDTSQSASDDSHPKEPKKESKTAKKKTTTKGGQKTSKPNGNRKPKNSKYNHVSDNNDDEEEIEDEANDDEGDEMGFFYNVAKTSNTTDPAYTEKSSKAVLNSKTRPRNSASNPRSSSTRNRGESSSMYASRRTARQKKNEKYIFLLRMLELWLDYLLKALMWLVSLVTDIVWLSYGIVCDKVCAGYAFVRQHYKTVAKEVRNSANLHRRFLTYLDRKFSKNSKWAFWRRLFRRATPLDTAGLGAAGGGGGEFYKNGRLPQTGEEAMYSLLNCKGKDAYSILGVSQDCSQEQIRKHYKKIAVLVHPDKNKQPGAEEAFKVLQRAFELIGEPENRQAYERNLAEALNAEKAWTELNDLLTQLHAKIAEAANTIRCSSCGLRHPRKPTGRPHYAARECNSCKIRHSAREGDIWAETSFMGICWKYLALMEGNVYDITEWANCQKGALSHLQPNSHSVQYRIVLGNQQQQQQQQQPGTSSMDGKKEAKKEPQFSRPSLDDFLTNLYGGPNQQSQFSSKRRTKKN
uniref:J domain-containing protein n=1 Tax=Lutzomyia longipalpis TaxID=7200 RepID=A0A1B0C8N7_LUTLO